MAPSAELSIALSSRLPELAELAIKVEEFLHSCGVPDATILQINIALEELLTNTIKYGHRDGASHPIGVSLAVALGRITVAIEDEAAPFDPFARPPVDTAAPLDDRNPGGLGIHLVKEMIERVDYQRVAGRNCVTLCQPFTAVQDSGSQREECL